LRIAASSDDTSIFALGLGLGRYRSHVGGWRRSVDNHGAGENLRRLGDTLFAEGPNMTKLRKNEENVTMDGNEAKLLDRYEAQFGETPPIAFLDPQTSKRMMMDAIQNNRPFNEKDLDRAGSRRQKE
jgi:hypothetical protein